MYDLSSQYALTEAGEDKIIQLRQEILQNKNQISDLELLFEYIKKMMDSNSEVCFLVGEEHCSKQASQKIHTATEYVKSKFDAVKLADIDLINAQKGHIEKTKLMDDDSEEYTTPEY